MCKMVCTAGNQRLDRPTIHETCQGTSVPLGAGVRGWFKVVAQRKRYVLLQIVGQGIPKGRIYTTNLPDFPR
jgi:hypothetical protein